MKLLIVGGSGFVSGELARMAAAEGHRVWTITRGRRPQTPGCVALVADRADAGAFDKAVADAGTCWDMVVDCIGYGPGDIRQDLRAFARRAGRLVFISTDFVYDPERRRFPQPEDTEHYLPPGGYGGDKRLAELELAANAGGLAWTVLRPCHIYGPGSELGCLPLHGRDPQLVAAIRGGRPLRLVGGGRFLQQPIFARDLARLILSVPAGDRSRNAVFNTAGPDLIESREFYRIVAEILGCAVSFEEVPIGAFFQENPGKASFLCHRIYGHDRLRQAGLCVPATPIRQGLTEHVEWILRRDAAEGR